jgi:hypothetical protein
MKTTLIVFLSIIVQNTYGQVFFKTTASAISPASVIIENYYAIKFDAKLPTPVFQKDNIYTYLQQVRDRNGIAYHIIYQADFSGNLSFLAYSNNLLKIFTDEAKPMIGFLKCMTGMKDQFSGVEGQRIAIDCVIKRLNEVKQ